MNAMTRSKLFAVGILVVVTCALFGAHPVHAMGQQTPDPSVIALEIVPVCSDPAAGTAAWNVTNKNSTDVQIGWNNVQNNLTGSFVATPGQSTLYTGYVASDPNNTTQFAWAGNLTQTNAKAETCQPIVVTPPVVPCIDGTIQQNLVVTWTARNKVSVHTLGNAPLCADVHVFFSSYVMPDSYDGNGFYGNPTAYPQIMFDSADVVLAQGSDGTADLTITLPDNCANIQTDFYYGPQITSVGSNGHGTQNILSAVYLKSADCTVPPVQPTNPGKGGAPTPPAGTVPPAVTTPAPQTPAAPAVTLPATLPETGATLNFMPLALLSVATYVILYLRQRRLNAKA